MCRHVQGFWGQQRGAFIEAHPPSSIIYGQLRIIRADSIIIFEHGIASRLARLFFVLENVRKDALCFSRLSRFGGFLVFPLRLPSLVPLINIFLQAPILLKTKFAVPKSH